MFFNHQKDRKVNYFSIRGCYTTKLMSLGLLHTRLFFGGFIVIFFGGCNFIVKVNMLKLIVKVETDSNLQ